MKYINRYSRPALVMAAFFSWALLCSHELFEQHKSSVFKHRRVLKKDDVNTLQKLLSNKNSSEIQDHKTKILELSLGQALVDRSIYKAAKKDMLFIAMSQPAESFRWVARGINFVTKPHTIKPKSAPDGCIIGGLIPVEQKYSKIGDNPELLNRYQTIMDELLKNQQAKAVPVVFQNKTAVARKKANNQEELLWVPSNKIQANDKILRVLADHSNNIYVSDVDGLLLASKKGSKSQWDQNTVNDAYGLHAEAHMRFAEEANTYFGKGLINHSSCHSWDKGVCEPSYPLTAYSPDGIHIIEKGPSGDGNRHLWAYLNEADKKGYIIRPNCQWELPSNPQTVCHLFKDVDCQISNHPCKTGLR